MFDFGHAEFSTSAAARNVTNALNPLSPGGMNPKGTHGPTLAWAIVFLAVAFLVYHTVIKR